MRVHALQTGQVTLKESFLHARPGLRGKLALLRPGPWAAPVPIRAWLIEHDEHRILIDAGETAAPKDMPFARHAVGEADELPHALGALGLTPADVTLALLTHVHPDHYRGAVHLTGPVLVRDDELAEARSWKGRVAQRLTGAPLPARVDFQPVALDGGPFGSFSASRPLTPDGRVVAVATPGHTAHHLSVVAVDDEGRHLLLAGDAVDTLEQLLDRRADAIAPDPELQRRTIDVIRAHGREHPTVLLPTHDPDAVARLEAGVLL